MSTSLPNISPRPSYAQQIVEAIVESYNEEKLEVKKRTQKIVDGITEAERKVERAKELILNGDIEPTEYRRIKEELGSTACLQGHLNEVSVQKSTNLKVKNLAEKAVSLLFELDRLFENTILRQKGT